MIHFREPHALRHQIDWRDFPAVVIESDDWGACEYAPTREIWVDEQRVTASGKFPPFHNGKLESPEEMERFSDLLSGFSDSNGSPAVVTGFICLANPDFEKIKASGFREYHDLFVDEGFPCPWKGGGLVEAWRRAISKGVFAPEFHSRFHHSNARNWMKQLRENSGGVARTRFAKGIYCQDPHDPEYGGMRPMEMEGWIGPAVAAFERTFGFKAAAGVTSDATPLTEILWAAHGIRTFCLRNFSIPGATPLTYHTKPWNNQDPDTPMGAWNSETDVIYMSRNVFFEPAFDLDYSFDRTMRHVRAIRERNEPIVISTHRLNYVNWDEEITERGFREFRRLLEALSEMPGVRFLSTREAAGIYREGRI